MILFYIFIILLLFAGYFQLILYDGYYYEIRYNQIYQFISDYIRIIIGKSAISVDLGMYLIETILGLTPKLLTHHLNWMVGFEVQNDVVLC